MTLSERENVCARVVCLVISTHILTLWESHWRTHSLSLSTHSLSLRESFPTRTHMELTLSERENVFFNDSLRERECVCLSQDIRHALSLSMHMWKWLTHVTSYIKNGADTLRERECVRVNICTRTSEFGFVRYALINIHINESCHPYETWLIHTGNMTHLCAHQRTQSTQMRSIYVWYDETMFCKRDV